MNNDRPPASKLRKWLMGNNESTLPGQVMQYYNKILAISKKNNNNMHVQKGL